MGAINGLVAAVVAVDAPLDQEGRVAESFAALANAHGGHIEARSTAGLTAIFPAFPQGLQAAAELQLAAESVHVRCGVVALDVDSSPSAMNAAVAYAHGLCRSAEQGQVLFATQSAMLSHENRGDNPVGGEIVGRDRELATLAEALRAAEAGRPQVLTLAGELGSGRTTMLAQLRDLARARGFVVLQATGAEGLIGGRWSSLRAAVITMPLDGAASRLADRMPSLSGDGLPDDSTIAQGLLAQASLLTDDHPLLITVDDIDLLDPASQSVVRTLASGLAVERCLVLAAAPNAPEHWLNGAVIDVPGLTDEALEQIIERDGPIDPGVLRRCVQLAGGNPLAAREVSRSLSSRQRAGQEPLPLVPEPAAAVLAGFRKLLARASESAQRAAVVAAADETGDSEVVGAALVALGESPAGVEEAEEAGILSVGGSGLRFTHPLLRSVAYHQVAASSRRAAHKALAVVLDRPRQATARAYQLAAAADGPNGAASEALALVAETELGRGDPPAAARAYATAARLTADEVLRDERLGRAAVLYLRAGDLASVGGVLGELSRPESHPDAVVMRCLVDLARLGPSRARNNLQRSGAPELSDARRGLDAYLGALAGEAPAAEDSTVPLTVIARALAGVKPPAHLLKLERSSGVLGVLEESVIAHALADGGWPAEASRMVLRLEVDSNAVDPVAVVAVAGHVALDAGRPLAALETLGDASASPAGATPSECLRLLALARARLYCGRLEDADRSVREATAIADRLGLAVHESALDILSGLVLHAQGSEQGVELLARAARRRPDRALPELVVATLDRGGSPLPGWEADLRALADSSAPRVSLAARRALAALKDDTEELMSIANDFDEAGLQLDVTLTRGVAVGTAVRAKRPEGARLLTDMAGHSTRRGIVYPGSHYWNQGGTQLRQKLSPAEHRVALAVGTGATNKEVSAQLFISVKTVDYHLQNIYRKLGARSRTELAVLMAGNGTERGSRR